MNIKQTLLAMCHELLRLREDAVNKHIKDLQAALQSETKSTAGDKHETGRAMLQLEREKLGRQLQEIEKERGVLSKINTEINSNTVGLGSVVYTSQGNYFIAVSAGNLQVNQQQFYAVSSQTPIAKVLLGQRELDTTEFRNQNFKILKLL